MVEIKLKFFQIILKTENLYLQMRKRNKKEILQNIKTHRIL